MDPKFNDISLAAETVDVRGNYIERFSPYVCSTRLSLFIGKARTTTEIWISWGRYLQW